MHRKTTTVTCETCGLTFERDTYRARQRSHHFCSRPCFFEWNRGSNNPLWKADRGIDGLGYIWIRLPDGKGRRAEHRWVWEQANGPIPQGYEIHHRNEDRTDNRLENLELVTLAEHRRRHHRRYSDGELIEAVHELARRIGRRPVFKMLDQFPDLPSTRAYRLRFGTWANVLKMAGYPLYDHRSHPAKPIS